MISILDNKDIKKFYAHKFDFGNQTKTTYDDWLKAFEMAIQKRAVNRCFVGLSSGYDSGALTKELSKQKIRFKTFSMFHNEDKRVITQRLEYIPESQVCHMDEDLWQGYYDFLKGKINDKAMKDPASMGVAYMFETARDEKRRVCISGQGGDEIISDYALYPKQSTFKGKFPDKLTEWPNFRGNMQMEYLMELEEIADLYGIEVRYPFLDIDLVQEFLWLTPELKNKHYKAPLREYLVKNEVPFNEGIKKGFNPI